MVLVRTISEKATAMWQEFLRLESLGGLLLAGAAVLAIVLANSPVASHYVQVLEIPLTVTLGGLGVDKPLLLWINDGLMAVFFLLVGLELKREVLEGQLSSLSQLGLPAMAALGGVAVPALVYTLVTLGDPAARGGWAIPAATDIAFALAILTLLGSRVPASLKVFLVTVAVLDDLAFDRREGGAVVRDDALDLGRRVELELFAVAADCPDPNRLGALDRLENLRHGQATLFRGRFTVLLDDLRVDET